MNGTRARSGVVEGNGCRRLRVVLWALAPTLAMCGAGAAAGPEVVRVRVPSKDVTRYFPAGTGLRFLSPSDFEAKVAAAGRGTSGERGASAPRLIRARHRARWESGVLRGRSELVVAGGPGGPFAFPMEPWTPAVLVEAGAAPAVGATDAGAAVLRLSASSGEQTASIDWEQRPRPLSRGCGFALGLPAVDTTVLELELPRGWTAAGPRGVRRGPIPTDDPARALWEIDGDAGRFDLVVAGPGEAGATPAGVGAGAWMSTRTEVDLRRAADLAGSMINWTADARLELDPRHHGTVEAELEPGLELIDVKGDAVRGYRTSRSGDATRVVVTLAEGVRGTTLQYLAHASVPPEGTWSIPAIRPVDATWTGGRTSVILDEGHAVHECRERAGRAVPSAPTEARGGTVRLVFEAEAPTSVAELVLGRPAADLACTVRGQVVLGGAPPRLDARLDWSLRRGSVSQLEVELSPAWLPDQVRIAGLDDPLAWHSSPLPSGGTRLRVLLPASVPSSGQWTLIVGATSAASTTRGPLALPRVHPSEASVVDEAWLAWGDVGTTIRPDRARGLAWIDPDEVSGLATPPPAPGLRPVLAWRWIEDKAEARVDRERIDRGPRVDIRSSARLEPDGQALTIEGTLTVESGGAPLDVLPIWAESGGRDVLASWTFRGDDGAEVRAEPIEGSDRERLDGSGDASARRLRLDLPARSRRAIAFRARLPWTSPGEVPLLRVPRDDLEEGRIRVEAPAGMRCRTRSAGPGRLHVSPAEAARGSDAAPGPDPTPGGGARDRLVRAFSYNEPDVRLELVAEPMMATPLPGVVRDAYLATSWDGAGHLLGHLRLLVQFGRTPSLSMELPDGLELVRVRRDGADLAPVRSGRRVTIPAPSGGGGARSSLIVMDYAVGSGPSGDGALLGPDRPRVDFPCLSFTWEVSAPPGWRAVDPVGGLLAMDRGDRAGWPVGPLGFRGPGWPWWNDRGRPDLDERLEALDGRLGRLPDGELTLAGWFSRWDTAPWAIVVDRLALGTAGMGPRTPCVRGRLPADRRASARSLLEQNGLAASVFPGALLITTKAESERPGSEEAHRSAIAEAMAWGSDRSDRFQTVARWRGEAVLRTQAAADPTAAAMRPAPGRRACRFEAAGWPDITAGVHLVDARRRAILGWIVAGLSAIVWSLIARRVGAGGLLLPTLAFAGSAMPWRWLPSRWDALTAGALVGASAILVVEVARRWRRVPRAVPSPGRSSSSLLAGVPRGLAGAWPWLLLALGIGSLRAAPAGRDPVIVALFPYEGAFDPSRRPDRVILRLEDYERLVRASAVDAVDVPASTVIATASGHRVARDAGEIVVETELELAARGPGPFAWRFPVASSREITATIGGASVPIAVEPGGEAARVVLPGAGNYLLALRRRAATRDDGTGAEVLRLPVNATPSARLIVAPPSGRMPQGVAETRGRMERKPDGSLDGRLGPSDRIVVRWAPAGREGEVDDRLSGSVEGLILWDVTPAGDRVRARLTYHRDDAIASVRVAHDRGVVLRSARVSGGVRVYVADDPGGDRWTFGFDPPMPASGTLSLDCWRPSDSSAPGAPTVDGPAPRDRRLPSLRPEGVERYSGLLGVRRPGDWTGRLVPRRDPEPVDDESFVKAWGSLPDEPLTFCGTSRLGRDYVATLSTGPVPHRMTVRPTVQLRIESGRIVILADAEVIQTSAPSPILNAELPEGMRVTGVLGDELIDWAVGPGRRLHLCWRRGESHARRVVRIVGWIPVSGNPLELVAARHRVRTPWIGWPGAEPGPGLLLVYSATAAEIAGARGLSPAPSAATAAGVGPPSPSPGPRLSYRVVDPDQLGELSWEPRPPRIAVSIESQLAIDPEFGDWVAAIRYDVLGGALDRINLRIPVEWATRATLQHAGEERRTPAQVAGPAGFWTLNFDRPLWGSHRFLLRAGKSLGSAGEVSFPAVAPLGKEGGVNAYLRVVNATGRPLAPADTTGLRRILPIFQAAGFADRVFARVDGTNAGIYRVEAPSWALRIPMPPSGAKATGARDDAARVELADVTMTVMPDRSVLGRALYDLDPDSGRMLTVDLPAGGVILWAADEPEAAVPLRDGASRWSFAVDPDRPGRICVLWRTPPPRDVESRGTASWAYAMPRAGPAPSRALVTAWLPSGAAVEGTPAGLEPASLAALEEARADRIGRTIRRLLSKIDRSSGRDHERLVSLLIDHEQALRASERLAEGRGAVATGPGRGQDALNDAIAANRAEVEKAVKAAGLSADWNAARSYVGRETDEDYRPAGIIPEPSVSCRIRALGRPTALSGTIPGLEEESPPRPVPSLTIGKGTRDDAGSEGDLRPSIAAIALAAAAVVLAFLPREGRGARLIAGSAVAAILSACALVAGPAGLVGGLGLAAFAGSGDLEV